MNKPSQRGLKTLPLDRKEGQTPKLSNVALGRSQRAQLRNLESVIVLPTPDFMAELITVGINGIPQAVVSTNNLIMNLGVCAEF